MTEQEVVQVLACRAGWTNIHLGGVRIWRNKEGLEVENVDLLNSRDALTPILESLMPEEWIEMHSALAWKKANQPFWGSIITEYLLTLPPRDLAFAIAEVLQKAHTVAQKDK